MKDKCVIFDLDGTLAIINKRLDKARIDKSIGFNWDEFFNPKLIETDEPNWPVININKMYKREGYKIYIFSGRLETTKEKTVEWLERYRVSYDFLAMRPKSKMYQKDDILKREILYNVIGKNNLHKVEVVYDDRKKVVDMWRKEGLKCFQVASGNF